jgi:hypothetical protein
VAGRQDFGVETASRTTVVALYCDIGNDGDEYIVEQPEFGRLP